MFRAIRWRDGWTTEVTRLPYPRGFDTAFPAIISETREVGYPWVKRYSGGGEVVANVGSPSRHGVDHEAALIKPANKNS